MRLVRLSHWSAFPLVGPMVDHDLSTGRRIWCQEISCTMQPTLIYRNTLTLQGMRQVGLFCKVFMSSPVKCLYTCLDSIPSGWFSP